MGIVAEAPRAARLVHDDARCLAPDGERGRALLEQDRDADVTGGPVAGGHALELGYQVAVVRVVEGLTVQPLSFRAGIGRESLRSHAGRSTEGVDLDARVVGDGGQAAGPLMEVAGLGQRVLLEGVVRLEAVLHRIVGDARLVQTEDLEPGHLVQDPPDLAHLARAPGGHQELHDPLSPRAAF